MHAHTHTETEGSLCLSGKKEEDQQCSTSAICWDKRGRPHYLPDEFVMNDRGEEAGYFMDVISHSRGLYSDHVHSPSCLVLLSKGCVFFLSFFR